MKIRSDIEKFGRISILGMSEVEYNQYRGMLALKASKKEDAPIILFKDGVSQGDRFISFSSNPEIETSIDESRQESSTTSKGGSRSGIGGIGVVSSFGILGVGKKTRKMNMKNDTVSREVSQYRVTVRSEAGILTQPVYDRNSVERFVADFENAKIDYKTIADDFATEKRKLEDRLKSLQ